MSESKIIVPPKPMNEDEEAVPLRSCPRCRYFEIHNAAASKVVGGCRFNPPMVCFVGQQADKLGRIQPLTMSFWPAVGKADWCSKFEDRAPRKMDS